MEKTQTLLQVSVKLYEHLTVIPKGEERDQYIELIHQYLDERGEIIQALQQQDFKMDSANKTHQLLLELDKGIRERLNGVLSEVKLDMKELQKTKKNEKQYTDPYSTVRVMDGMYYDKKK